MKLRLLIPVSVLAAASNLFGQGNLTPLGPPAATMKTLDQVEARTIVNAANTPGDATNTFIISAPGSYYFTGNITGDTGKHGISVQSDDVTLDLNGFALISGGGGAFRGINVPAAQTKLCVRNGSVRGWTDGGVRVEAAVSLAEKLLLVNNTAATGLHVGNGSMIKDCVASGNGTGFFADDRTHIINCISTENTGVGFNCLSYVTLIDCTAGRNFGNAGIVVQGSCTVIRCNASRNILSGNGITAGPGCTIADCTAGANGNNGIFAGTGSTVRGCTAQVNLSDGIAVTSYCHVTGNTCVQNGGHGIEGILSPAAANRIEGNSCSANAGYGIKSSCQNCDYIMRNTCVGNGGAPSGIASTDYNPKVGSYFGVFSTPGAASPSPWANF